ncbi:sigma-70 family RNA polymerase sigma factor [Aureibacillus halotolerans]|uniref:RNA polymerase sigma-70 factor (ECF subfamily) n=1 Tax=Aureibacillus halotolerans TaxID=1508390 RepID=A0A4R6U1T2_9BACI|nr:sigma-70 family RNA polymerase sigma factor [Aureibacillus halotolerans]TDQ38305.1 RNA polymerase sigma-70 factor (ECF subfamily) [Aureibacillus halotolerans]
MHVSEVNLVEQIKRKNEDSLSFILQQYGALIHGILRKYLHGNPQDIEECVSDVLVAVWFHIDSYDAEKNEFRQWVAAIAKYRAIDRLRTSEKEKRRIQAVSSQKKTEQHTAFVPEPPFDIQHMLDSLSDVERGIFQKYYVEGVPSDEIAFDYQAKPSWVHNKLSRGRKKLKTILQRNEG